MDDVVEIIGTVAALEADRLKELVEDAVDYIKDHAPQYFRYVVYSLKGLRL